MHVCSNVEVRDQLRALFHRCVYLSLLLLRQGLSLGLELADSTMLAESAKSQISQRILMASPPQCWATGVHGVPSLSSAPDVILKI